MTKLKDKLSASVRMAKAGQKTLVKQPAVKLAPAHTAKPVATKSVAHKPAAQPPAGKTASRKAAGNEVPVRSEALFPARIWPD